MKNKQLTETNLDLIDKVRDAEKFKDEEIAKWKTNYEKLEKLKEESDKSKKNKALNSFLRVKRKISLFYDSPKVLARTVMLFCLINFDFCDLRVFIVLPNVYIRASRF